jgi:hypothetical protein
MNNQIVTEPFSAGYELVRNAEVHTYDEDEAIMDAEMLQRLEAQFGQPLIGYVGGLHYQFKPERAVPGNALALPETNHSDPGPLLVQR